MVYLRVVLSRRSHRSEGNLDQPTHSSLAMLPHEEQQDCNNPLLKIGRNSFYFNYRGGKKRSFKIIIFIKINIYYGT